MKILNKNQDKIQRSCNCKIKESCPLNGKCLHQCLVCKAEVTTNTTYKEYYVALEGEFKSRYNNHMQSFRHLSHINNTELSKHLWTLKANGPDYHLKWSIKLYASQYKCGTRRCDLCLTEKMIIALADLKELNWYQNVAIGTSLFWTESNKDHLNWYGNCLMVYT